MKLAIQIIEKINQLNLEILNLQKQGLPLFKIYYKLQNKTFYILKLMGIELKKYNFLNWDMKMFYILGYLPRSGTNILVTSCLIFTIIKCLNSNVKLDILEDGSILGCLSTNSKNNIILQAHMDIVYFGDNKYGPYGKDPRVSFYYKNNFNYFGIRKENEECVLGADDGKGIITILKVIKEAKKDQNFPNITFLITSIEEAPFGQSINNLTMHDDNFEKMFPKDLKTTVYFNIDSYSGTEVDLYFKLNPSENHLKMQNWIVAKHEEYLRVNNMKSTQASAWINPPSEVTWVKFALDSKEEFSDLVYVSLACGSENPHTLQEEINLFELCKFNNWFVTLIKELK